MLVATDMFRGNMSELGNIHGKCSTSCRKGGGIVREGKMSGGRVRGNMSRGNIRNPTRHTNIPSLQFHPLHNRESPPVPLTQKYIIHRLVK